MASIVEKAERKPIKIKTAGKTTPFGTGGGQKLSFSGEDGISYTTFVKSLFEYFIVGTEVDVDVELRKSGEYSNWIVTQMYKDGKPLAEKSKGYGGSGGGGYRGKSPEEVSSIENQVRVKAIAELWAAGKLENDDPVVHKLKFYLNLLGTQTKTSAPAPALKPDTTMAQSTAAVVVPKQAELIEKPPVPKVEPVAMERIVTKETLATLKSTVEASEYKDTPLLITAILDADFGVKKAKELTESKALELIEGLNEGRWNVPF